METMDQQEYIEQLEAMVYFIASAYEAGKYQYHDKHLETCSVDNPNRREITDQEWNEIGRFPQIQGANGLWLARFVKNTEFKKKPIHAKYMFDRIKKSLEAKTINDSLKEEE